MMANRLDYRISRAMERRGLKGNWGEWRKTPLPAGIPGGHGWCREVREAWANNLYAVLIRPFADANGEETIHLAIRTISQLEPAIRLSGLEITRTHLPSDRAQRLTGRCHDQP